MSDNVILAQQTIEGFAEIEEGAGIYGIEQEQTLSLTVGETYTVAWDGTEYSCIAVSMDGAMALGNLSLAGISSIDSGEPFVIGCIPAALTGSADMLMIYTTDAAESHMVAIAVEGIVTFNRYGDKQFHYGIQTLTLDTTTEKHQRVHTKGVKAEKTVPLDMADGDLIIEPDPGTLLGKVTVQKPETMTPENIRNGAEIGGVQGNFVGDTEEITVDLNMADGDQVIVPSADGKVISKVTVKKPETLVPENIAEGVNIADIIGTFSGRGKVGCGIVTGNGGNITIPHGLGVVPDVVIVSSNGTLNNNTVMCAYGISTKLQALVGFYRPQRAVYRNSSYYPLQNENGIDTTNGYIFDANANTFKFGNAAGTYMSEENKNYVWVAIGGLT